VGSWVHYLNTGKTEWSEEVFSIYGYEPHSIEPSFEIAASHIHPDDLSYTKETSERAIKTKTPASYSCRIIARDGTLKFVFIKLAFDTDNPNKLSGIIQDITKETELRRQLTERKRFIETMVDNSVDRIMAFDKDMVILVWNKCCEEYYGIKREDALGKTLLEVFPQVATQTNVLNAIKSAFEGQHAYVPPEKEIYADSISERYYTPLKQEDGKVYSVLCILHDVTKAVLQKEELKELNKSLENKNRELEEKNDEISSFAFVASHDLKEPLRKIHTYSNLLLEKEVNHLTEKGREYFNRISNYVKRMDMLIEDIMVLTKIHSDRDRITTVNLNKVLESVLEDLSPWIEKTGAKINSADLPEIKGNENQIFYLFRNLLHNAIKFQSRESTPSISIKTEKIKKTELPKDVSGEHEEYVKLSFTDNGIGFDPRYAKKVFQVFQRLHTKHDYSGTGMGLAICKKIMDNHDGFIVAETEEDKGSIFICYFPL
jgi:PAS domain S-box-containing protein